MNEKHQLNVLFFRTEMGREPVREWLRGLDTADKHRIGVDIEKVRLRWPVSMPLVRKLETDLWEIRSNLRSKRIARILFSLEDNDMVILHGFVKKSKKIPLRDLRLARKRKDMWRAERII